MPKKTIDEDLPQLQKVCRYFGRALGLTMVMAKLEPGDTMEDTAIAGMDEGWNEFARALLEFARED